VVGRSLRRIIVAGGGVAAYRCAFELRKRGFSGSLKMVCAETEPPYDRTFLSKEFLSGVELNLALEPERVYAEREIDLWLGTSAAGLNARAQRLTVSDGSELAYDRLIICTGANARLPRALSCPGVHVLRHRGDAESLRATLAGCERLIVVGGGFVGSEVASSAVARGVHVTMVEALQAPLVGILGAEVSARLAALHRGFGVELLTGASVAAIIRRGRTFDVSLGDGRTVCGDAVVVAVGMAPAVEWLHGSGLISHGVLATNAMCQTRIPGVFAAGDCASWWNERYRAQMRVEHWDTAGRHGAAAGAAALGEGLPFAPIPFFWSDQHGVKLQWIGYAPEWNRVELDDLDPPRTFVARYYCGDTLVGAFASNQPRAIAAVRHELEATCLDVREAAA
jgi:3-phenylpropionate/trans-cinnamate dioxygenase ferredoxin reductase subunit